jgi:hypothetical protein
MIGDKKTPRVVLQNAYLLALQSLMVELFHVDEKTADKSVSDWWGHIAISSAMKSGSFLHTDPLQTAAELRGVKERDLSAGEEVIYRRILQESLEEARRDFSSQQVDGQLAAMRRPVRQVTPRQKSQPISIAKQAFAGSRN